MNMNSSRLGTQDGELGTTKLETILNKIADDFDKNLTYILYQSVEVILITVRVS